MVELRIYLTLANGFKYDFTELAEGLRFSTIIPGGFANCSFRLKGDTLFLMDIFTNAPEQKLQVYGEDSRIAWEGLVLGPSIPRDEGIEMSGMGYWGTLSRQYYYHDAATTNIKTIIEDILTNKCPDISTDYSNIDDPGQTASQYFYQDEKPSNIIPDLVDQCSATGMWIAAVWEDQKFYLSARPTAVAWHCSLSDMVGNSRPERDLDNIFNNISCRYEKRGSPPTNVLADWSGDTTSQGKWGKREVVIPLGEADADASLRVRDMALAELKDPKLTGSFVLSRVLNAEGKEEPLYRVRAGQLIKIRDILPGEPLQDEPDGFRIALIRETEYDAENKRLRVSLYNRTLSAVMGKSRRLAEKIAEERQRAALLRMITPGLTTK